MTALLSKKLFHRNVRVGIFSLLTSGMNVVVRARQLRCSIDPKRKPPMEKIPKIGSQNSPQAKIEPSDIVRTRARTARRLVLLIGVVDGAKNHFGPR